MMKKVLFTMVAVAMFFGLATSSASAQTISELQALIAQLTAQLAALIAQQQPTFCAGAITQNLTIGDGEGNQDGLNAEVRKLQNFLIQQGYLRIPRATGIFGNVTKAAVMAYQTANGQVATGYVGPIARTSMNATICGILIPTPTSQPVAQCLTNAGVKAYGVSWGPSSQAQKEKFGEEWKDINFLQCDTNDKDICGGMSVWPTWVFLDGSRLEGVQEVATLVQKAGCGTPVSEYNVHVQSPNGGEIWEVDGNGNSVIGYDYNVPSNTALHFYLNHSNGLMCYLGARNVQAGAGDGDFAVNLKSNIKCGGRDEKLDVPAKYKVVILTEGWQEGNGYKDDSDGFFNVVRGSACVQEGGVVTGSVNIQNPTHCCPGLTADYQNGNNEGNGICRRQGENLSITLHRASPRESRVEAGDGRVTGIFTMKANGKDAKILKINVDLISDVINPIDLKKISRIRVFDGVGTNGSLISESAPDLSGAPGPFKPSYTFLDFNLLIPAGTERTVTLALDMDSSASGELTTGIVGINVPTPGDEMKFDGLHSYPLTFFPGSDTIANLRALIVNLVAQINQTCPGQTVPVVPTNASVATLQSIISQLTSILSSCQTQPLITVISPNGGESFKEDDLVSINWNLLSNRSSSGQSSQRFNVWLLDEPSRLGKIIISNVYIGPQAWRANPLTSSDLINKGGQPVTPSGKYVIFVECADHNCTVDDSNNYFTITSAQPQPQPSVTITSPAAGTTVGRTFSASGQCLNYQGNVDVYYYSSTKVSKSVSCLNGRWSTSFTLTTSAASGSFSLYASLSSGQEARVTVPFSIVPQATPTPSSTPTPTPSSAPSSLIITAPSDISGKVGIAYEKVFAGTATYANWSFSGTVPPGLHFSNDVRPNMATYYKLSGTPTQSGTFSGTLSVTETVGRTGSKAISIVINPADVIPASLSITSPMGEFAWLEDSGNKTISWNSTGLNSSSQLYIYGKSSTFGNFTSPIVTSTVGAGSASWNMKAAFSGTGSIPFPVSGVISIHACSGDVCSAWRDFTITPKPVEKKIIINSPSSGTTWRLGQSPVVSWTAAGFSGSETASIIARLNINGQWVEGDIGTGRVGNGTVSQTVTLNDTGFSGSATIKVCVRSVSPEVCSNSVPVTFTSSQTQSLNSANLSQMASVLQSLQAVLDALK